MLQASLHFEAYQHSCGLQMPTRDPGGSPRSEMAAMVASQGRSVSPMALLAPSLVGALQTVPAKALMHIAGSLTCRAEIMLSLERVRKALEVDSI